MVEDCLGWTDVSNNKAWMSEQISCTNNAESILWFAKKQFPDIGKVTQQSLNPQGPKGRFHILAPWNHAIFNSPPDQQAAKDFLVWLMDPKQVERWYASADSYYAPFLHAYDNSPFWSVEPRNLPYRDSLEHVASARLARTRSAGRRPRAWPNTSSSTCSPRRAPANPPRRSSPTLPRSSSRSTRRPERVSTQPGARLDVASPASGVQLSPLDRARGRVQLADGDPARAVPGRAGWIPVRLRHLAQPGGPPGRQTRRVHRARQLHQPCP